MLVTSRETQRWVVPKGWPWAKHSKREAAAREAWEEAGVTGEISRKPVGAFRSQKELRKQMRNVSVSVSVYLLDVNAIASVWPEAKERKRRWFRLDAAVNLVHETELKALLQSLLEDVDLPLTGTQKGARSPSVKRDGILSRIS